MSVCSGVRMHRAWQSVASATLLAVLAACGGGGGGSSSTPPPPETSQPASVDTRSGDKIRLGGVVSKGLLGNADVRVLSVKTDGTIDESGSLATGVTADDGSYLTSEFTITGPFVVEVKAKPCSDTTIGTNCSYHQDEVKGARQYLPTAFQIRAIVTAAPANDRVNVTLFSEFAIQAALKAAGGLNTANMTKAQSMVNNLFGTTDLNTVIPKTLGNSLTPAEARLAALLKAASTVASNATALANIGCATETPGTPEATLCVVNKLSGNANTSKYVGDTPAVAAELDKALQTVVTAANSAELTAVVSTTSDKLTNETLSVPAPANTTVGAYDAIKALFNDLVNTARRLLTATDGEKTLQEARAFEAQAKDLQVSGDTLIDDSIALEMGVELWRKFEVSQAKVSQSQHRDLANPRFLPAGVHCKLQKANGNDGSGNPVYADAVITDAPADIARATCRADYAYNVNLSTGGPTYTAFSGSHIFVIVRTTPSDNQHYTYKSVAVNDRRQVTIDWGNQQASDTAPDQRVFLQNAAGTGTRTSTSNIGNGTPDATLVAVWAGSMTVSSFDTDGTPNGLQISGDIPEKMMTDGSLTHAATSPNLAHMQLSDNVTALTVGTHHEGTFAGTMVAIGADNSTVIYTLSLANGELTVDNEELTYAKFTGTLLATTSKFVGTVDGTRTQFVSVDSPNATITGKLYHLSTPTDTTTTPFVEAKISYEGDNSHFDNVSPYSTSNYRMHKVEFDGYITAPDSPKIRVAFTGAGKQVTATYQFGMDTADAVSGDFFVYNNDGSLKRDVTFSFRSPDTSNGQARLLTDIVDPTNKVSFSFGYNSHNNANDINKADTWADILVNGVTRGKLDTDTGSLPKVFLGNGENFSLDTGTIQY